MTAAMADGALRLVYTSTAAQPFRETALEQLLQQSRRSNATRDVTGLLLFRDGRFLQILEGPAEAVRRLVDRIAEDPRHHAMRILLETPIAARLFSDWSMGYRSFRTGSTAPPSGFRDSFDDLVGGDDLPARERALFELTLWFRTRSGAGAPVPAASGATAAEGAPLHA
ncbi:BLUF domain-containing protein [Microbacterium sp. BLY]|uniref:BLUF domain-containing protein n=1 Tax=Microbacterium sp. BLY TaxID=2823280 RepID=UPI0027DE385C|nr:BLUF domain-containing protein [Microbacterium sp. BLY]